MKLLLLTALLLPGCTGDNLGDRISFSLVKNRAKAAQFHCWEAQGDDAYCMVYMSKQTEKWKYEKYMCKGDK